MQYNKFRTHVKKVCQEPLGSFVYSLTVISGHCSFQEFPKMGLERTTCFCFVLLFEGVGVLFILFGWF